MENTLQHPEHSRRSSPWWLLFHLQSSLMEVWSWPNVRILLFISEPRDSPARALPSSTTWLLSPSIGSSKQAFSNWHGPRKPVLKPLLPHFQPPAALQPALLVLGGPGKWELEKQNKTRSSDQIRLGDNVVEDKMRYGQVKVMLRNDSRATANLP